MASRHVESRKIIQHRVLFQANPNCVDEVVKSADLLQNAATFGLPGQPCACRANALI